MTWCSENSAVPGFLLASSTIHCRFVNRFAGSMSLPVCPANGSLHATPPFPRSGPGEPRFPAVIGTMKALRLPMCVSAVAYLIRFHCPPDPPAFVSAAALLKGRRSPSGPGFGLTGRPSFRLLSCGRQWDLSGLQAILPVPLLRSSTPVEPMCPRHYGHIDAAPATHTAKASAMADFGAHSHSFGTRSPTLRVSCCHSRARLASGWLAGLCREGVEPSGPLRKVSARLTIVLLSCSPDANGFR